MPKSKFNSICNGLFHSKLLYCLQVFSNVWCNNGLDDHVRHFSAFTKSNMRKLQILQNKILRIKCGLGYETRTNELIEKTGDLSVHQLCAYTTLTSAHRTIISKQPHFMHSKLRLRNKNWIPVLPERFVNTIDVDSKLTLGRGGFFFRAASLFNMLPVTLRKCQDIKTFKMDVKKWIKSNIPVKPE